MKRPATAYLPPALERGRAWGFAINLYALRSERNWGVGDFTDLASFVRYAIGAGAGVVGINPLHAPDESRPETASPYAPSSRYFLNPLYIDVTAVAEFSADAPAAAALRARLSASPLREEVAELRRSASIEYARVARLKHEALSSCYDVFGTLGGRRRAEFDAFVARGGERLERFARYGALAERFGKHSAQSGAGSGWLAWPVAYRHPDDAAVATFAHVNRRRVDYFKYVQWLADEQLAAVARAARDLTLGLYRDVAVGASLGGADVWSDRDAYVLDETIGAPPDAFAPLGQDWGLPPLEPSAMVRRGGRDFSELLAANMAYAGALRLDHAMALLRVFRIPRGKPAIEGRYVAYPFKELAALAARASVRARCLVVGEDLGNVPPGFRERMEREGFFSYRLLLFEREADGRFRAPCAYPRLALATATTHDLPTLCGWALGRDLIARERIGLLSASAANDAHAARRVDVSLLLGALQREGVLESGQFVDLHRILGANAPGSAADADRAAACWAPLVRGAYRYLARSPARLVLIALDDALGELDQVNLPGTQGEYPNWRRKSRLTLEAIAADPQISALAGDVAEGVAGRRRQDTDAAAAR